MVEVVAAYTQVAIEKGYIDRELVPSQLLPLPPTSRRMSPASLQETRVTIPLSSLPVVPHPKPKLKQKQKASREDDKDIDMAEDSDTELLSERPFRRLTK